MAERSGAAMFSLGRDAALKAVATVVQVVDRWQQHFLACGVSRRDIEFYAQQIDRPFLADQRRAYGAPGGARQRRAPRAKKRSR